MEQKVAGASPGPAGLAPGAASVSALRPGHFLLVAFIHFAEVHYSFKSFLLFNNFVPRLLKVT